jgi:plasmid stabilization system protein ParE
MKFYLSRQAETALEQLWDHYFEQGGTRLADRVLAEIHDAIDG